METNTPLHELVDIKWAITALANHAAEPGSHKGEVIRNAAKGMNLRLDWVIRTLKAAGEGEKNMGV